MSISRARRATAWPRSSSTAGLVAAALFAGAVFGGCGPPLANLPREGDLHPRLTRYAYIEEGKLISFLVDTAATRRREGVSFIPIGVGVANIGLKGMTITRESFTLIDDQGQRYSMATVPEARTLGSTALYDIKLSENFVGVFATRFSSWPAVESEFFPVSGDARVGGRSGARGGIVRNRVSLSKYSWMVDVIYFPHPEGKLIDRRFELWLDTEELEEPVFVKFRVK